MQYLKGSFLRADKTVFTLVAENFLRRKGFPKLWKVPFEEGSSAFWRFKIFI